MKRIIFDAGPVISFTANNLLERFEEMKKKFDGEFILPEAVKNELVDKPLQIKRFEFEALQVDQQINCGTFKVLSDKLTTRHTEKLLRLANSLFYVNGNNLKIVHYGEMAAIAAARYTDTSIIAIDERTTRELIEEPGQLEQRLKNKLKMQVKVDYSVEKELRKELKGIKVIRSVELAAIAFELGLLNRYIEKCSNPSPQKKKILLDSILWGVKLEGCSVSREEISQIIKLEKL